MPPKKQQIYHNDLKGLYNGPTMYNSEETYENFVEGVINVPSLPH